MRPVDLEPLFRLRFAFEQFHAAMVEGEKRRREAAAAACARRDREDAERRASVEQQYQAWKAEQLAASTPDGAR